MKKKVCLWLAVLMMAAGVWGARGALWHTALGEEEAQAQEDGGQEEEAQEPEEPVEAAAPVQQASEALSSPKVLWSYGVPLSCLYAKENMLVNRDNLLAADFEPSDLVKMSVKRATSAAIYMQRVAAQALEEMFEAAKAEGYTLYLKSGYRSYGTQKTTYTNRLANNGGKDDGVVAAPGSSEHQTGLACDVLNGDYAGRPRMTTDFAETAEAQWMKENCATFGFILRYPEGKTDITGIIFEPWHFRYVGKDVAGYIMRNELTLEEFTDQWQMAVAEFQGRGGDIDQQIAYEEARSLNGPESYILEIYGEDGDAEVSLTF